MRKDMQTSAPLTATVDKLYEKIAAELKATYKNMEPFLLIKASMLKTKYPTETKQKFWLDIYYKAGTDIEGKSEGVYNMVGKLLSYHGHYQFVLDVQADLETILQLAQDPDIERIEGEVYPL
jgi:hypothetical protein